MIARAVQATVSVMLLGTLIPSACDEPRVIAADPPIDLGWSAPRADLTAPVLGRSTGPEINDFEALSEGMEVEAGAYGRNGYFMLLVLRCHGTQLPPVTFEFDLAGLDGEEFSSDFWEFVNGDEWGGHTYFSVLVRAFETTPMWARAASMPAPALLSWTAAAGDGPAWTASVQIVMTDE